jgi:hypothetical protein
MRTDVCCGKEWLAERGIDPLSICMTCLMFH